MCFISFFRLFNGYHSLVILSDVFSFVSFSVSDPLPPDDPPPVVTKHAVIEVS